MMNQGNWGYNYTPQSFNYQPQYLNSTNPSVAAGLGTAPAVPSNVVANGFGQGPGAFAYNPAQPATNMNTAQLQQAQRMNANTPQVNNTWGNINATLQGVAGLGQLGLGAWSLWQTQQNMDWQKKFAEANFANQLQSYNDRMEARIKGMYAYSTPESQAARDAEIEKRKLEGTK